MAPPIAVTDGDHNHAFAWLGGTQSLDGSASHSVPPGVPIATYTWTLLAKPVGSAAVLVDPLTSTPDLTPDLPGDYLCFLVVNDGTSDSETDPLLAPQSAFSVVRVTTQYAALYKPAQGERIWDLLMNPNLDVIDGMKGTLDAHAARHAPGGPDPVLCAAPGPAAVQPGNLAPAEGAGATLARSTHVHQVLCAAPHPAAVQPGNAAPLEGAAATFARSDHTHQVSTAAPVAVPSTASTTEGASSNFARSDHVHSFDLIKGTLAERPAAGQAGRLYFASNDDGGTLTRDNGVAWEDVARGLTHDHDGTNSTQVDHDDLLNVSANQHHAEDHKARHATAAGADPLSADNREIRYQQFFHDMHADGVTLHLRDGGGGGLPADNVAEGAFSGSQLDVPRSVNIACTANAGETVTVNGVLADGSVDHEDIVLPAVPGGVCGIKAFARVTSIDFPAVAAGQTIDVQMGSLLGLQNQIAAEADVYKVTWNRVDHNPSTAVTVSVANQTVYVHKIMDHDEASIWYHSVHAHPIVAV